MKLLSLVVAFCFSMNVMASTGSISALERAVDEYQYALSVEWDQKDAKFYDAQTMAFFSKLSTLIKTEGLTQTQIISYAEKRMNNKAALDAMKLKLSLLSKANSAQELAALVRENSKDLYARGASWNGEVLIGAAVVAVIVGVLAYAVWFSVTHECVAYQTQWVCGSYNTCYGGYYNNHWCGGYATYCGWDDVCVDWEKK